MQPMARWRRPTDFTGAPRYNDPRTLIKTGITNARGVYPDMGAFEFVETASSAVDLVVASVAGPLSETAGQIVTVQWSDVNIGTAGATGPWHDTISLVPQNGGSPLVVGTVLVAQNAVLGPGQTYPARPASSFRAARRAATNGKCRSTAAATFLKV